jgi:hypothetical protein
MKLSRHLIAAALAILALVLVGPPITARPSVDLDALIPPPPPGANCRVVGTQVICHTGVVEPERVNEPLLDLPCGTVYETSTDVRRGLRWYDSTSLTIVKRLVFFDLEGTWSLSAVGVGPTVRITGRAVNRNVIFPDPEDPDTWPATFHGPGFTIQAEGFGVIAEINSLEGYEPDDFAHGVANAMHDPDVASELCAALGA